MGGVSVSDRGDVRAAAERLRAYHAGDTTTYAHRDGDAHYTADVMTLLAQHPPDDAEAVTEGWLRAVGAREPHGYDPSAPPTLTAAGIGFGVLVQHRPGEWDWCRGSRVIGTIRTRGQFRRLCAALGVTLNEGTR